MHRQRLQRQRQLLSLMSRIYQAHETAFVELQRKQRIKEYLQGNLCSRRRKKKRSPRGARRRLRWPFAIVPPVKTFCLILTWLVLGEKAEEQRDREAFLRRRRHDGVSLLPSPSIAAHWLGFYDRITLPIRIRITSARFLLLVRRGTKMLFRLWRRARGRVDEMPN